MTELSAKPNGGALAIAINPMVTPSDQFAVIEARIADRSIQPKDAAKPSRLGLILLSAMPKAGFENFPIPTMPKTPAREPVPVVELPREIVRSLELEQGAIGLKRHKPKHDSDDEIDLDDDSDHSHQMRN